MKKITVTKRDITLGIKNGNHTSNTLCPVGRAINRTIKGTKIRVGVSWASSRHGRIYLPELVSEKIRAMCGYFHIMEPFSFNLTTKQVKILTGR